MMNNKSQVDYSEVPVPFVIVSVVVFLVFVLAYFIKKPEIDRFEQSKIEQNNELVNDMVSKGILKLKFVLNLNAKYSINIGAICWFKVDSVLVNDSYLSIDSLYRKECFIYRNCDGNYYYLVNENLANIEEYNFEYGKRKLNEAGGWVCRKVSHEYSKEYLPKCFDD